MSSSANKDVKIAPGAVVCLESKFQGPITVGSLTVIHPKASIIAEAGPITIGENNIIEEQATIIHTYGDEIKTEKPIPLSIGVNNVFEVGCEIRAKSIGDHNVFEPKCFVGPNVEIGNGCVIGAGCRITVAEKLPDLTVITGRDCVRSEALDRPPGSDDLSRQHDELTVMREIFTKEEFSSFSTNDEVHIIFEAQLPLQNGFLLLLSKNTAHTDFSIRYLPPVRLEAFFPRDYPSQSSPGFVLSCCWLTKSKLNRLAEELTKLWEENQCEILFIWCSFLKDQSLDLLNIVDSYDLSEKCLVDIKKQHQSNGRGNWREAKKYCCSSCNDTTVSKVDTSSDLSSNAAASTSKNERNNNRNGYWRKNKFYRFKKRFGEENDSWRIKPKEKLVIEGFKLLEAYHEEAVKHLYFYLIEYNASKSKEEFNKTLQDCNVCFSPVLGELCTQLPCGHVTCVECLKRMCEVHIKYGTMESIVCPQENCGLEIEPNVIRELVSKELFDQYDRLMLNRTLDKISNMTYCPRVHCQYPVSTQGEDSLAVCPNCSNAFCIFCKRAYHGIEGCKLKSAEKLELIELYQNGDYNKKLELEKRYGKKQLTELVTAAQSELWMSENAKKCPCCHIHIEKSDGCNKMICRKCNTNFCWMCLTRLSSLNPYLHFQDPRSKCFNLLFEGTYDDGEERNFEDEEDDFF